ncbi:MAG: hypothetical protein IJU90_06120 [Bacteroidales bacterium]|nr:hypothetical protein [Bacteroidales bacterium]
MNENFKPSVAEIERCKKEWENENKNPYFLAEKALKQVFQKDGDKLRLSDIDLLTQIPLLNTLYKTNIKAINNVYQHYLDVHDKRNMEKRLMEGDLSLVEDLCKVPIKEGKTWRFYSFTTKFCSFHNPEKFPIYDSVVADMLYCLNKKKPFSKFTKISLKDYPTYVGVIHDFQKAYGLTDSSFWEIDKMLWINGKEGDKNSKK